MSTVKLTDRLTASYAKYESVVQCKSAVYNSEFTIANPNGNYYRTPLQVSIKTKRPNSTFLIMMDVEGYCSSSYTNGWNIAIGRSYNQNQNKSQSNNGWQDGPNGTAGPGDTLIAGLDLGQSFNGSGPEDIWTGMGHNSGFSTSSWSKCRTVLDSPGVAAGTTIVYTGFLGGWTTSSSSISIGWGSYIPTNKITVFEFAQ
jgi:hypothetical protein